MMKTWLGNRFKVLLLMIGGLFLAAGPGSATILQIDWCGATLPSTVPLTLPMGDTHAITLHGDGMDRITGVTVFAPGFAVSILPAKTAGGGMNTTGQIVITPNSIPVTKEVIVTVDSTILGLLLKNTDTFKIKVMDIATITGLSMTPPYPAVGGSTSVLRITGTEVDTVGFTANFNDQHRSGMHIVERSASKTIHEFDLQFYSAEDVLIRNDSFIDYSIPDDDTCSTPKGSAQLLVHPGFPDLVPLDTIQNVFRFIGAAVCDNVKRSTVPDNLCNALPLPTKANPTVDGFVTIPDVRFGIRNAGLYYALGANFHLKSSDGILANVNHTFEPGEVFQAGYHRHENRRHLMRSIHCAQCYDLSDAPFDWKDPTFTVVADPFNGVNEGPSNSVGETNNARIYP